MNENNPKQPTIVLGIGNLLLGDEGIGVHAVRALMCENWPSGIEIMEIGTALLDALPALSEAGRVVVIDAMKAEGNPGTIYRTSLDDCSGVRNIASMHGFDLARVMALAGRREVPPVTIFGVEPASLAWSMDLSGPVAAALPPLLDVVRDELHACH